MCLNFLKLHSLCNEESIYIYEYMLTFSPKSWVCLAYRGIPLAPPLCLADGRTPRMYATWTGTPDDSFTGPTQK